MSDGIPHNIDFEDDSRFDAFCRLKSRGMSNRRAYQDAGFQKGEYNPSTLCSVPAIKERIASYLDQRDDEREPDRVGNNDLPGMYNLTAEWVIENLMQNAKLAMENGSHAAANKSLEMLGQHIGILGGVQGKDPAKVGAQVQASLPDLVKFAEKFSEAQAKAAEPFREALPVSDDGEADE